MNLLFIYEIVFKHSAYRPAYVHPGVCFLLLSLPCWFKTSPILNVLISQQRTAVGSNDKNPILCDLV